MSRTLWTGGLGFFSRLANVRLLAVTDEARGMEKNRRRPRQEPAPMEVQVENVDAVAGSEFVDDRIRRRE